MQLKTRTPTHAHNIKTQHFFLRFSITHWVTRELATNQHCAKLTIQSNHRCLASNDYFKSWQKLVVFSLFLLAYCKNLWQQRISTRAYNRATSRRKDSRRAHAATRCSRDQLSTTPSARTQRAQRTESQVAHDRRATYRRDKTKSNNNVAFANKKQTKTKTNTISATSV